MHLAAAPLPHHQPRGAESLQLALHRARAHPGATHDLAQPQRRRGRLEQHAEHRQSAPPEQGARDAAKMSTHNGYAMQRTH